jgi:hypothetical protein
MPRGDRGVQLYKLWLQIRLMTGIDAVLEIVLGNIKLPSEKAEGIVPFRRQLQACFGPLGLGRTARRPGLWLPL